MAIDITAGRVLVTNAAGATRLDTNQDLFHILTTLPQLTINVPVLTASTATRRDETNVTTIGSCHASADLVIGAVMFASTSLTNGIGFSRWTTYMGGDLVWAMTAPVLGAGGGVSIVPTTACLYRFYATAGTVFMAQRLVMPKAPEGVTYQLTAHTLTLKLKCALFT